MGRQIMVYFVDNHKALMDRDKVLFRDADGTCFAVSDDYKEEDEYASLIADGKALVNWQNVCWIREYTPKDDEDDL